MDSAISISQSTTTGTHISATTENLANATATAPSLGNTHPLTSKQAHASTQASDADSTITVKSATGSLTAHCSLYWSCTPVVQGKKSGLIGHFEAQNSEAARCLLQLAQEELRNHGCEVAIGPINGSTWQKYRFVSDRGTMPPFFLEPENPVEYPGYFLECGFSVLCNYFSTMTDLGQVDSNVLQHYRERANAEGITTRTFRADAIDEELRSLYQVTVNSFASNFLYQSISEPEFMDLYKPLIPVLDPRLVIVAERENRCVGFILLVPNRQKDAEGQSRTVIVKTAARLPDIRLAGLGSLLLLEAQQRASLLGYERAIHALMHEDNASLKICLRYGRPMRKYSIYHRSIAPH